ncbi:MAG: tyrosyl-tRNA synthetase, partial [Flammeovirgaceae bacterium]
GKSEGGNIWLDAEKTSPYQFYQFWFNASDEDIENFIKIFSLKSRNEVESLIASHREEPHLRILQKDLAAELTERIHGEQALEGAIEASNILFGKSTAKNLQALSEKDFLDVFSGVEQAEVSRSLVSEGANIVDFLSEATGFLSSKGEARRALKENSISINKEKVQDDYSITESDLIQDRYILLQRGKKNYFIAKAV